MSLSPNTIPLEELAQQELPSHINAQIENIKIVQVRESDEDDKSIKIMVLVVVLGLLVVGALAKLAAPFFMTDIDRINLIQHAGNEVLLLATGFATTITAYYFGRRRSVDMYME